MVTGTTLAVVSGGIEVSIFGASVRTALFVVETFGKTGICFVVFDSTIITGRNIIS